MDFSDALKKLKDGKKVKRSKWDYYLHIDEVRAFIGIKPFQHIIIFKMDGSTEIKYYNPVEHDLFADDWEVIEDELPEIKLENQKAVISCKCGNHYNLHSNSSVNYSFRCCLCGQEYKIIVEEKEVRTPVIDFSKLLHLDQIKINFDYRIPRLEIKEPKKDDVLTKYREWLQGIINGYDTKRKHAWIEQDNDAYHFYFKRSLDYSLCLKKLDELEG